MSVRWIEHKGQPILYVDFRNKADSELSAVLAVQIAEVVKASRPVRILTNVEGTALSQEFMDEAKQIAKAVLKPRTERSAVVGVEGVKSSLLRAFNSFVGSKMRPCTTEAEALDFLAR